MQCLKLFSLPALRSTISPPLISPGEVRKRLNKINTTKATHQSDIPSKIIKEFSFVMTKPLTLVFNVSLQEGLFPAIWKQSAITPKVQSAKTLAKLRLISLTKLFGRIFEKTIGGLDLGGLFSPYRHSAIWLHP